LTTERLTLTPLTVDDAAGMVAVYADERMFTFTGGVPMDAPTLRRRYEHLAGGWNHDRTERWCNWIVRMADDPTPVGVMQATVAADHAWGSVAWEIDVAHQGRGLASEAAVAMVGWLRASGVGRIIASIHPDHAASARVAARLGLEPTDDLDDGEVVWSSP
jgi:RimJ/RimL family protein N-acetyltransferase